MQAEVSTPIELMVIIALLVALLVVIILRYRTSKKFLEIYEDFARDLDEGTSRTSVRRNVETSLSSEVKESYEVRSLGGLRELFHPKKNRD